jgi:hypothetical protein
MEQGDGRTRLPGMKTLLIILGVILAISVAGFVIKTLFWIGVIAAIAFVAVGVAGAIKSKNDPHALR